MKFFTYIVECADKTLYTGYTENLEKRLAKHNSGLGAKYTRGRIPVFLKYFEEFESKSEAMRREFFIKKLSRKQKLEMIEKSEI